MKLLNDGCAVDRSLAELVSSYSFAMERLTQSAVTIDCMVGRKCSP